MSMNNFLQSAFGRAARAAALALGTLTGAMALPALAQESAVPAVPTPLVGTGMPVICLPMNNLDRREHPFDEAMNKLAKSLMGYSGWDALMQKVDSLGNKLDGFCPMGGLQEPAKFVKAERFTVLGIVPSASPEQTIEKIDSFYAPEALYELALKALSTDSNELVTLSDTPDTAVFLRGILYANAASEQILYSAEHFMKTEDDKALQLAYKEFPQLREQIDNIFATAVDRMGERLADADRDGFKKAFIESALKNPVLRAEYYHAVKREFDMLAGAGYEVYDMFNTTPTDEEMTRRLDRFGPAVQGIDLKAIAAELAQRADDPAAKVNEEIRGRQKRMADALARAKQGNESIQVPERVTPAPGP
jgi:hypothetical protein